jgi:hypothetical protein
MSRVTDLTAAVVVSARHCHRFDCAKCSARSRWARRKSWRCAKSPKRSARPGKR